MPAHQTPATRHYHDLVGGFSAMTGKTVLVTGCTSGTGLVLARTCGDLGARVVMLNRPSERADRALKLLHDAGANASLVPCDLASFDSVRAAGAVLRESLAERGVDVLCNNAGVMGLPDMATGDGFDVQMQANHLSHFLLTHLVWPLLERAGALRGEARVVNHSSGARGKPGQELIAAYLQRNGGDLGGDGFPGLQKWARYRQSKLANLLFTYALHERANARPGNRVKSLCAHPGPTDSGLQAKTTQAGGTRLFDRYIIARTLKAAQSVEDGASGIARCCCETGVESGAFYGPEGRGRGGPAMLLPPERNPQAEALLWTESMAATGVADFFG
ncbi:SDR family NAD(P)-dependent oxidoreductase [Oricola sp.]|uniref:SDR family NAD(P)-dependent oxidoreductase n=1 Tax=Oricola sp. TaxID=1979950 RepID=UPI0025ECDC72|nr:SDR family NAD(P)-dependent oxidoreductase [Oricola sp.]MCI5074921.1 SDR family NAD(P)-dependent oxidoreductase [Oricola sp.]